MPSKLRLDRLADLAGLQGVHGLLEGRYGLAGRQPAQVSALWRRDVFGISLGQVLEAFAVDQSLAQLLETGPRFVVGHHLRGLDEYVACMGVGHPHGPLCLRGSLLADVQRPVGCRLALRRLTTGEHLQDMKAVAALDDIADLACLQIARGIDEQVWPAFDRTYAEFAALKSAGPVGRGSRNAGEVSPAPYARQQALGLLTQFLHRSGGRAFGYRNEYLGQPKYLRTTLLRRHRSCRGCDSRRRIHLPALAFQE